MIHGGAMSDHNSTPKYSNEGATGCLARLYWMFAGNVIVFFALVMIAMDKSASFLTPLDLLFAAGVFSVLLTRYLDTAYFKGTDSDGNVSTMEGFRKYLRNVLLITLPLWGVAHFFKSL
jgi:hypothetical protein